jgi:hypothetical protein
METQMTEKHDVTQSSNPDVQQLLVVITGLARRLDAQDAQIKAIYGELASLPTEYVVPGPKGELPPGTMLVPRVPVEEIEADRAIAKQAGKVSQR